MKRLLTVLAVVALTSATLFTSPSVYPTGTTIYHPDKAWSGYTVLDTPNSQGAVLIGGSARRRPHQEARALVQVNWRGDTVWSFDHADLVEEAGQPATWMARQ